MEFVLGRIKFPHKVSPVKSKQNETVNLLKIDETCIRREETGRPRRVSSLLSLLNLPNSKTGCFFKISAL